MKTTARDINTASITEIQETLCTFLTGPKQSQTSNPQSIKSDAKMGWNSLGAGRSMLIGCTPKHQANNFNAFIILEE